MSDDEESFESAKDENFEVENASEESSEDEPLVKKSASPKKKSASKGKPAKKDKKSEKNKKKGRVSFALVATESEKAEEEYEASKKMFEKDPVKSLINSFKNIFYYRTNYNSGRSNCWTSRVQWKVNVQNSLEELWTSG